MAEFVYNNTKSKSRDYISFEFYSGFLPKVFYKKDVDSYYHSIFMDKETTVLYKLTFIYKKNFQHIQNFQNSFKINSLSLGIILEARKRVSMANTSKWNKSASSTQNSLNSLNP